MPKRSDSGTGGSGAGGGSSTGRSFAAALRNLAKQAGPESGSSATGANEKESSSVSKSSQQAHAVSATSPPAKQPSVQEQSPLPPSGFQPYRPDDR